MSDDQVQAQAEAYARKYADDMHTMNCHQPVWQASHRDYKAGYEAGHASRDAEVGALRSALASKQLFTDQIEKEMRREIKDLRTQLAEAVAIIEYYKSAWDVGVTANDYLARLKGGA